MLKTVQWNVKFGMNYFFWLHFRFITAIDCALSLAVISTANLQWDLQHSQKLYSVQPKYLQCTCSTYCNFVKWKKRTYIMTAPALRFSIRGCIFKSVNFFSIKFCEKFKFNGCKLGWSQIQWVQLHPLHSSKAGAYRG